MNRPAIPRALGPTRRPRHQLQAGATFGRGPCDRGSLCICRPSARRRRMGAPVVVHEVRQHVPALRAGMLPTGGEAIFRPCGIRLRWSAPTQRMTALARAGRGCRPRPHQPQRDSSPNLGSRRGRYAAPCRVAAWTRAGWWRGHEDDPTARQGEGGHHAVHGRHWPRRGRVSRSGIDRPYGGRPARLGQACCLGAADGCGDVPARPTCPLGIVAAGGPRPLCSLGGMLPPRPARPTRVRQRGLHDKGTLERVVDTASLTSVPWAYGWHGRRRCGCERLGTHRPHGYRRCRCCP